MNELYLIKRDTVIDHINDKVRLYAMLRYLAEAAEKLPYDCGNNKLIDLAYGLRTVAEDMFGTWGIPERYVITGDENELENLLDEQFICPNDECNSCCGDCCEDCDCYDYDYDSYESRLLEGIGEILTEMEKLSDATGKILRVTHRLNDLASDMLEERDVEMDEDDE